MSFIRRFLLLLCLIATINPTVCMAQPASDTPAVSAPVSDASAAPAASSPHVTVTTGTLLEMVKAKPVEGSASEVTMTQDQFLYLSGSASSSEQRTIINNLIGWSFFFVGVSLIIIIVIAYLVRSAFWKHAAQLGPTKWRTYLLQLPLGAPEGSVRALLSLFVVVFGLLVLALQRYLSLSNTEAISASVASVITFYFTARSSEQARKAALQAQETLSATVSQTTDALQKANQTAADTQRDNAANLHAISTQAMNNSTSVANAALKAAGVSPNQAGQADASGADSSPVSPSANLLLVRDQLSDIQQVARGANALGIGADILPNVTQTITSAQGLLDQIQPLLSGKPDPATIANVLQDATSKLPLLEASGTPGVLAEAIQVIGDVATPVVAGLPGGPIGIVGGVVVAAIRLVSDASKLQDFKAALLGRPFDPVLLPDVADREVAPAVLANAPLMNEHFAGASDDTAMALMALAVRRKDGASTSPHLNSVDLSQLCLPDITNGTANILPQRTTEFVSQEELMQAFDDYLGALVRMNASSQLSETVAIPAFGNAQAPATISLQSLADAGFRIASLPKPAAELERLVYLGETLGKLPIDPEKAIALVVQALAVAASSGLVQTQASKQ